VKQQRALRVLRLLGILPFFAAAAAQGACGSDSKTSDNFVYDGGPLFDTGTGGGDGSGPGGPCAALPPLAPSASYVLRYDQVGYLTKGTKWAIVLSHGKSAPSYSILDATGCVVGTPGKASPRVVDTTSRAGSKITGDRIDLSAITAPGTYWVALDGVRMGPIVVGDDVYKDVLPTMLKFLGLQRCGPTTTAASKHAACHLYASLGADGGAAAHSGDGVAVDDLTTTNITAASGPAVDAEGGWHDAGDYIKFVGTTAFVLAVDLVALRDHQAAFAGPNGGQVADALKTEMRWGLDWLLKMIGGATLYHQVSGEKDHDPDPRVPEADTAMAIPGYDQRPLFRFATGQGANLLGRGAAAFAVGSVVFKDDAAYSATLLAAAKSAYTAAQARKAVQNPDPADFYDETSLHDDLGFGAAELALATGDPQYQMDAITEGRIVDTSPTPAKPLYWGDTRMFTLLETARAATDPAVKLEMGQNLTSVAIPMLGSATNPTGPAAAYHYALDSFDNGTIEQSLGAAAVCLGARRLGGNDACDQVGQDQIHWMLGLNPFGYSFLIGLGATYPKHPQHAWSQKTGMEATGAIVGGPTGMPVLMDVASGDPSLQLPTTTSALAEWSTDDLVYEDDVTNYVVNEPAIDFTAPLVFVMGELLDPRK
jgi:hypothetical protein